MGELVNLKKTGSGWEFETEAALEDFVWANLSQIFGLTPLKRQYAVKGQFCDILGLADDRQLTVLELKNVEDRYIVQQLTRYYDALGEEKPFAEQVDFDRPIRLIAVTPNFHRDNYTDRKYCHLNIQFLQFQVLVDGEKFYFQLKDVDSEKVWQFEIPYQERESNYNIPDPPRKLLNLLAKCQASSDEERGAVLRIRRKILSFDSRMKEVVDNNVIYYGKGKSYSCAELYFRNYSDRQGRPNLFLRLPEPYPWYKRNILRLHISTNENWDSFFGMVHYPKGFIPNKIRACYWYEFPDFINRIENLENSKNLWCYKNYENLIKAKSNFLEILVEIALETWLKII